MSKRFKERGINTTGSFVNQQDRNKWSGSWLRTVIKEVTFMNISIIIISCQMQSTKHGTY